MTACTYLYTLSTVLSVKYAAIAEQSSYSEGQPHAVTSTLLRRARVLMADVISPMKGFIQSLSRFCSNWISDQLTANCFSSASPSLTSGVPSSTCFTMQRTSRSISAQRCTVEGLFSFCPCLFDSHLSLLGVLIIGFLNAQERPRYLVGI